MEIIDCIQGEAAWFEARLGSIGGSSIASVVAGGKGKMRNNLMYRLAGEILSGVSYEGHSNAHMQRGLDLEAEAREVYEMVTETEVHQVGLVKDSAHKHYSPDGLVTVEIGISMAGIIEIKCPIPSVHIETIINNEIPAEYRKQCQWGLHICAREFVDFVSYCPLVKGKEIWTIRRGRDEQLIREIDDGADKFIMELAGVIRKVKEAL